MKTTAKIIAFPTQARLNAGAYRAENPFLNSGLFEGMLKYENECRSVATELEAIVMAGGSNKRCPDPRKALSLQPLRAVSRRRYKLPEIFEHILARRYTFEQYLGQFGFAAWSSDADNVQLALDLSPFSKAEAIFQRAGIHNWRSLVMQDAAKLVVEPTIFPHMSAHAIFYLGDYRSEMPFVDNVPTNEHGQIVWEC